jgi:hypothetical protein
MSVAIVAIPILLLIVLLTMTRARRVITLMTRPREEVKKIERKQPTKTEASRECPNCGGTMEEGYLIGPQGIYWSKIRPLYGFQSRGLGSLLGEPLGLSSILRGMRTQYFRAYRCQRCGIVQVELNDEQP